MVGTSFQSQGTGVVGVNSALTGSGVGVRGQSTHSMTGVGVVGEGRGNGVLGQITRATIRTESPFTA